MRSWRTCNARGRRRVGWKPRPVIQLLPAPAGPDFGAYERHVNEAVSRAFIIPAAMFYPPWPRLYRVWDWRP